MNPEIGVDGSNFLDWPETYVRAVDGFGIPDCPNGVRGSHLAIFPDIGTHSSLKGFSRPVKAFNLAFIKYAPPSRKFWGICQRIVIKSCQLNVPGGVALAVSRIGMPLAGFNS
jgi:hypothetical protein